MAYALVSVIFGLTFGGLMFWTSRLQPIVGMEASVLSASALVAAAGLLYVPFIQYLQTLMDRVFFRNRRDRAIALARFSSQVAESLDLDRVLTLMGSVLCHVLQPTEVKLFIATPNPSRLAYYGAFVDGARRSPAGATAERDEEWIQWLQLNSPAVGMRMEWGAGASASQGEFIEIKEGPERLVIPVRHGERVLAYAVLGAKRSDEPYQLEEVRFAETIAAHSSTALQNAHAHQQVRHLQQLMFESLQGLPAGVVLFRTDGSIELHNEAFQVLADPARRASEAGPFRSLTEIGAVHPGLAEILAAALRHERLLDNESIRIQKPIPRFLMMSARPLAPDEKGPLQLVVLHDLTEYKQLEETLKRQEALARVGEFVSGINHEIRNAVQPLREVMNRLQAMRVPEPDSAELLARVPERMKALERLLDDLRNYARPIELRRRTVRLQNLLAAVILSLEDELLKGEVGLEQDLDPQGDTCLADGDWLKQVLFNLLSNAIDSTAGRAERRIRISTRGMDRYVAIEVADTGEGIAPADLGRLFQPFFTSKGARGTGLGLSICQKIVELHGGRIEVHSAPGAGSRFTVLLPKGQADPQAGNPIEAARKQTGSREG